MTLEIETGMEGEEKDGDFEDENCGQAHHHGGMSALLSHVYAVLSGVRALVSRREIHLHQCFHNPSPIKPTRAGQARLLLPPRDSIISSSVVARLPGCQPAGSLVFS